MLQPTILCRALLRVIELAKIVQCAAALRVEMQELVSIEAKPLKLQVEVIEE